MPSPPRRKTKLELNKIEEMRQLALRENGLTELLDDQHHRRDLLTKANDETAIHLKSLHQRLSTLVHCHQQDIQQHDDLTVQAMDDQKTSSHLLNQRKEMLQTQLTANVIINRENVHLRKILNKLKMEQSGVKMEQSGELEVLRKEMFEARMKVETTFRKTLQILEQEYKDRAYKTMEEESLTAMEENTRLNSKLTEKRDEVMFKMRTQQNKESKMKRDKINRDILENSVGMQEHEIELLERYQAEQEKVVSRTQAQIAVFHARLKHIQDKEAAILAASKRLENQKQMSRKARDEAKTWINHCELMCAGVEEWIVKGLPLNHVVGPAHLAVKDGWSTPHNKNGLQVGEFVRSFKGELDKDLGVGLGKDEDEDEEFENDLIWRGSRNEEMIF